MLRIVTVLRAHVGGAERGARRATPTEKTQVITYD
mgnify:CR=1 FL=1